VAQPKLALSTAFLQGLLHRCRAVKTPGEVGCLLQASKGSAAGHRAIWAACRPGER
jgi:Xaa-Pro aminopeptidase